MKFVCERCHTRYSIADDKVRQKILKIRCKTCENVITVRDPGPSSEQPAAPAAPPPPPRAPAGGVAAAREWFVAVNGEQVGPMTRSDAARRILQTKGDDEVYVWKDGLDGWKPPSEVPAIHQEVNALKGRTSAPPRVPAPPAPRPSGKPSAARPTAGAAAKGGAGKPGHAPMAAGGRGPVPATARLADNDSYVEEEHTQIQPFDAGVFAPEGFARPSGAPVSGSVLPFKGPGKANGGAAAGSPPAALDGLFNDLTPVPLPSGAVINPVGAIAAHTGLSQLIVRRPPVVKFIAAGAVVAVLITLVVVVLVSRPSDPKVAPQPAPTAAAKPPAIDEQRPADRKPAVVVPEAPMPPPSAPVRRTAKGPPPKPAQHSSPSLTPPALEPAPLSPEQASTPHRAGGSGPERRVPEFKGNRGSSGSAAGDGPTEAMIFAVVKKNQTTIKSCYERALKRDDRLRSGRIDVTAELGASGTVKSVAVTAPPEFVTVEACIKTAVRRWAFPVAPHEYRAEFPLILQGNL
jgi:predicted Zn finger-like uncharacterized protein